VKPRHERLWLAGLLIASFCLNLYQLGTPSLFDQDESEYAQIAVEMVRTGDPVTLHVNGEPWYVHPPLYMWLVAATGRLLDFNELTIRIWSVLGSLLAVYATVLLGRDLWNPRVGLLAGTILALTLQYLMQSRLAVFDTVLLAWMLLALHAFARGYRSGRRGDFVRFFLFAGLATLTKGPIGLLLPGLIIAAFVALRRAWPRLREVPWGMGLAVYAAVGLSWYGAQIALHGWAFLSANVGYYTLGRFFGVVEKHSAPWYFYVPVVLLGAFPWTTFWPAAAALHLRRRRTSDGSLLVLLGVAVPFLFYTAAQTKLPGYIMPVLPFAAIGVAALWEPLLDQERIDWPVGISLWLLLALVAALFGAVAVFVGGAYPDAYRSAAGVLMLPAGILAGGVVLVLGLAARGRPAAVFAALCVTMAATWVVLLTWVLPLAEAQKPIRPLAAALRAGLHPGDRIVAYRMGTAASLIYYTGRHVEYAETGAALRRDLCVPGRVFLVATRWELAALDWTPPRMTPVADHAGTLLLLKPAAVECAPGAAQKAPLRVGDNPPEQLSRAQDRLTLLRIVSA